MTINKSESTLASLASEPVSRRSALLRSGVGAAALAFGVPAGLSLLSESASAQGSASANLVGALKLKKMAAALYATANVPASASAAAKAIIEQMRQQEVAHQTILASLGASSTTPSSYNWTNNSVFNISDEKGFFNLARHIEDLTVRVLKGAIPGLFSDATKVSQVMSMHLVDARHAAISRIYYKGYADNGTSSNNPAYHAIVMSNTDGWGNAPADGVAPTTVDSKYFAHYVYGPRQYTSDHPDSGGEDNRVQYNNTLFSTDYVTDEPATAEAADKFIEPFLPTV